MSRYFDALARRVNEGPTDPLDFLEHVRDIEAGVFVNVSRLVGDREFPNDLRERVLGVFATRAVHQPYPLPAPQEAEEEVRALRYSPCLEALHDAFHDVARRRVETRFGLLSDHPGHDLERRDAHDRGEDHGAKLRALADRLHAAGGLRVQDGDEVEQLREAADALNCALQELANLRGLFPTLLEALPWGAYKGALLEDSTVKKALAHSRMVGP
jgi:hypothetical protein